MPNKIKKIALLFLLLVVFIAPLQAQNGGGNSKKIKTDWQNYVNTVRKITIQYPPDWQLNEDSNAVVLVISSPAIENQHFRAKINLIIQNLGSLNLDLEKYTQISKNHVETVIVEGKILSEEAIQFNNQAAKKLIYTGKYNGTLPLKWKQIYFIKDSQVCVLTYTALEDNFDVYAQIADKIFKSLIVN